MLVFIAQTLDGYIAGDGDSLDHLEPFQGNDYGYDAMLAEAGAVVLGRRTFDRIYPEHGWTYPSGMPGVVVTSRPLPAGCPAHVRAASDIDAIAAEHPNAFVDGGAQTIAAFLARGHIRRADIFTLPVRIGSGVRLFQGTVPPTERWELVSSRSFPCGTIGTRYCIESVSRGR